MNKQEFLNICHEAQHDAGSQINFNMAVSETENAIQSFHHTKIDPVAAFLAAMFQKNGGTVEEVKEDFDFYFTELQRVKNAIAKISSILLICLLSFTTQAQTRVTVDKSGNYTAVSRTATQGRSAAKLTGKTFTDSKGNKYPVYESKNGKLFIIRTSAKTGNQYNQYLKL